MIKANGYPFVVAVMLTLYNTPASAQSWMNDAEFWVAPPPGSMKVYHDDSNTDWLVIGTVPIDGLNWSTVTVPRSVRDVGYSVTECDGTNHYSGRMYPHTSISYYENIISC